MSKRGKQTKYRNVRCMICLTPYNAELFSVCPTCEADAKRNKQRKERAQ